jgi:hypothetical protein
VYFYIFQNYFLFFFYRTLLLPQNAPKFLVWKQPRPSIFFLLTKFSDTYLTTGLVNVLCKNILVFLEIMFASKSLLDHENTYLRR